MKRVSRSTGELAQGLDFTQHMRWLAADMIGRLDELSHIDLDHVAIRFCQARKAVRHGIQASLTPLRFQGGQRTLMRRGRAWTVQPVYDAAGREMLYLLSFYLPRFLERPLGEKLSTVIHELWHISPHFDGDLRRHEGRCYAHSHSQRQYDQLMDQLAAKWLALDPPETAYAFLRYSFQELDRRHGPIFGLTLPTPKLIRAAASSDT